MFNDNKKAKPAKQTETAQTETAQTETAQTETAQTETAQTETAIEVFNADSLMPQHLNDGEVIDNVIEQMKAARANGAATEMTNNYLDLSEFKPNEERFYVFAQMSTFVKPDTGESIPAVVLIDGETKQRLICAAAVVVRSLQNVDKIPCACSIIVDGKTKGKNGSYYNARVHVL